MKLTDRTMQRAATAAPQWLADDASLPAGSLVAYIGAKPARGEVARSFYYRWRHSGRQERLLIGVYAQEGESNPGPEPGGALSLKGARQRARLLADLVHSGEGDLRAHFARLRQATEEARLAAQRAREAAEAAARAEALAAERGSLQRLLEGYLGGLEAASKPSSRDARNMLTNHVIKAFPDLVARKAVQEVESLTASRLADRQDKIAAALRKAVEAYAAASQVAGADKADERFVIVRSFPHSPVLTSYGWVAPWYALTLVGVVMYTIFTPWFGLMMIWIFGYRLKWLPVGKFLDPLLWRKAPVDANFVFGRLLLSALIYTVLVLVVFFATRKLSALWRRAAWVRRLSSARA